MMHSKILTVEALWSLTTNWLAAAPGRPDTARWRVYWLQAVSIIVGRITMERTKGELFTGIVGGGMWRSEWYDLVSQ